MKITLYKIEVRDKDGKMINYRDVTAINDIEGGLVIHCCDINETAKEMFDDFGVEFYLVIDKENKRKLISKLKEKSNLPFFHKVLRIVNKKPKPNTGNYLLDTIYVKFGGKDSCFEDIMSYFKGNGVEYEYSRW